MFKSKSSNKFQEMSQSDWETQVELDKVMIPAVYEIT